MQEHLETLQEHIKIIKRMSESEGGYSGDKKARQVAPASPGRMFYGPGPMSYPGGMMYGPGMTGGPGKPMTGLPCGTATPMYR